MKSTKINVKGMHCRSVALAESLKELSGMAEASADHKKESVRVTFDESKISIEKIKQKIENERYKIK
jgi:copper chaperone CopZ